MNGRVNDGGSSVVHRVVDGRTACALPRRGHVYVAKPTNDPVTCKLCLKVEKGEKS